MSYMFLPLFEFIFAITSVIIATIYLLHGKRWSIFCVYLTSLLMVWQGMSWVDYDATSLTKGCYLIDKLVIHFICCNMLIAVSMNMSTIVSRYIVVIYNTIEGTT